MLSKVLDDAFGVRGETCLEWYLFSQSLFENLVSVVMHERGHANQKFVQEYAKRVPVSCSAMANIHYDLWSHVLRRATESVSAVPRLDLLDEAEIGQLHIAIVLDKYVLGLEISVDQVYPM